MIWENANKKRRALIKDSSRREDAVYLEGNNLGVLQYFRSATMKLSKYF